MKEEEKKMGVTFNGLVTFNGPMFDIHDNHQVTILNKGANQAKEEGYQPRTLDKKALADYVMRIMPLVNDDMKDDFQKVWQSLLDDEQLCSWFLQTKDRDFNLFNKYYVHGILGIMKDNSCFKSRTTDAEISKRLENVNGETKYRSSISAGISDVHIKKKIVETLKKFISKA